MGANNEINNLNIHHMEVPYKITDCTNKVVILRPSMIIDDRKYKAIKAMMHYMKENCGAKEVMVIPEDIDFDMMSKGEAIDKINDYIDELYRIKENLGCDEDDE